MLLHHAMAWGSFHAPIREKTLPVVAVDSPVRLLVSGLHYRPAQHAPVLKSESRWSVPLEGGCHLASLSVDGSRTEKGRGEMEVYTILCHIEL